MSSRVRSGQNLFRLPKMSKRFLSRQNMTALVSSRRDIPLGLGLTHMGQHASKGKVLIAALQHLWFQGLFGFAANGGFLPLERGAGVTADVAYVAIPTGDHDFFGGEPLYSLVRNRGENTVVFPLESTARRHYERVSVVLRVMAESFFKNGIAANVAGLFQRLIEGEFGKDAFYRSLFERLCGLLLFAHKKVILLWSCPVMSRLVESHRVQSSCALSGHDFFFSFHFGLLQ